MEQQLSRGLLLRPSESGEIEANIPPLALEATLDEQCMQCFRAFNSCVIEARRLANLGQTVQLAKARLRPLARQLDEQRLRMDVWMLDCGVKKGYLPQFSKEADLAKHLASIFLSLHTNLRSILREIKRIPAGTSTGQSDQAELDNDQIASTLRSISLLQGKLADMKSRIQMSQAINSKTGPYANVRRGVEVIQQSLQNENKQFTGELPNPEASGDYQSRPDDGVECPNCHKSFPLQIFSFHEETCKQEELNQMSQSFDAGGNTPKQAKPLSDFGLVFVDNVGEGGSGPNKPKESIRRRTQVEMRESENEKCLDMANSIEDQYEDPIPPTDSWGRFLSMRFREREAFYASLDVSEQQIIWKELQRIEYFRDAFKRRGLSASDTIPLDSWLQDARKQWNNIAFERCGLELARRQDIMTEERNCHILRAVQRRKGDISSRGQFSITSEHDAVNFENDNPDEPDYGYNGWFMAFAEDGRQGVNNPLCYGKFPHQKISIRQLLYDKTETPLTRTENKDWLRYFHLPANNMTWVEEAMSRYYGEDKLDFGTHRVLNARSKTERLLKPELWRGQQRGSIGSPVHSRQIESRFSIVPSASFDSWRYAQVQTQPAEAGSSKATNYPASSSATAFNRTDIALFMPYLHWETEKRLLRMSKIAQRVTAMHEVDFAMRSINHRSKFAKVAGNWRIKFGQLTPAERKETSPWAPLSPLGRYLWFAAKMFDIVEETPDERLLSEHLHSTSPLHMRRTLNQFYYWTIADTTTQDRNQVVCRGTRSSIDPEATGRVVMVDQLWMWILDGNTILTSFPRRWGRNKPDPSAVHRAIRDHFSRLDSTQTRSIYDLALIIIDECSRVFFDQTKPLDQRPEVVAIFGSAISDIAEMKTMAYERFGGDIRSINKLDSIEDAEELIRKTLNISFEWSALMESQHMIDELQIMQEIFTQQIVVTRDFERALKSMGASSSTLERAATLIRDMEMRRNELAGLEKLQAKTSLQLRELLDMKQQQAGIIEAKAAVKRADQSVVQGRVIVVFTVFTIFFLPLLFFASFFGMNAREFNNGSMKLSTEIIYMFSISGAIIFSSIVFAFSTWARTVVAVGARVMHAYVTHWMGILNIPVLTFRGTSSLKEFETTTVFKLRQKTLLKRFSQINAAADEPPLGGQDRINSWGTVMNSATRFRQRRTTRTLDLEIV